MRRRRGNLLITVFVMVFITMMVSMMLMLSISQRARSQNQAEAAGVIDSYIAISNICADAFKTDLEAQYATYVLATVENPEGINVSLDTYDSAAHDIQERLTSETIGFNSWKYTQTQPSIIISYADVENTSFLDVVNDLLDEARMSIVVSSDLSIIAPSGDDVISLDTGDLVPIEDIMYTVTVEKGTTQVVQTYRLSGEALSVRNNGSVLSIHVSGDGAKNILESQIVTRASTRKLT